MFCEKPGFDPEGLIGTKLTAKRLQNARKGLDARGGGGV
jgi:hypothetical protein